jgi:hypothetical protein
MDPSYESGLHGGAQPPSGNFDAWQMGKSVHDANQAELARQAQAAPSSSWSVGETSAPSWSGPTSYAGGGGAAVDPGPLLNVIIGVAALVFFNWVFPLLYPLAAASAGVTAFFAAVLAVRGSALALVLGAASLVIFWMVSRAEHRLAQRGGYRRARHVIRLLLVACAVSALTLGAGAGSVRAMTAERLATPLVASLVIVVCVHFFLVKATGLRERWHGAMEAVRLRPRNLG